MVMGKHRHFLFSGKGSLWLCVVCGMVCDGVGGGWERWRQIKLHSLLFLSFSWPLPRMPSACPETQGWAQLG